MLTKEIWVQALNDIKMYGGINIPPLAFDILKRLIEEHFTPQPLKFGDIKRGMYVYDNKYKAIGKVSEILTNCNCQRLNIQYNGNDIVYYENDRFYPVIVPQNTDMEEKKNDN